MATFVGMVGNETLSRMMFEQLFKENRKMLERLAYFYARDHETSKDIVSQSFGAQDDGTLFHRHRKL